MNIVTKIAAVKTSNAMWEYDPNDPSNNVVGGGMDIMAAIQMIAIKVSYPGILPSGDELTSIDPSL